MSFVKYYRSFINSGGSFMNFYESFINVVNSFTNSYISFEYFGISFINVRGCFIKVGDSFKNFGVSFIFLGGCSEKCKRVDNIKLSTLLDIYIGFVFYSFRLVNLIPLICLYWGDVAPKMAFTYFFTSKATFTNPVLSE